MLYTIPDYYQEFQCVADKCEDTCCAGWQIVIDKKTLKKYAAMQGDIRKKIWKNVNWFQKTFKQDKEKRCRFLNENNLCDLYLSQGENGFCKTCRKYPRHTEEFEGVREITLSVSCPEVARILMQHTEPVTFLNYEKEGEEEFEEFDPFLFSVLEDARKEMIALFQNRDLEISDRILLVLGIAHDMQVRMNKKQLFECWDVTRKYTTGKALSFVQEYKEMRKNEEREMKFAHTMFRHLYDLEYLKEGWGILLKETEDLLYQKEADYCKIQKEFRNYCKMEILEEKESRKMTKQTSVQIQIEQLLVYFLFTYFPGAVYDGEIYAKVQLAVYCVWMIWELWTARWLKNEKTLDLEEMTELVYRFSREVEHSDINLKRIEQILSKKWFLKLKK